MEIENIKDCINIAGNTGYNIEYNRAKKELELLTDNIKELEVAVKMYLIAVKNGKITVFPNDDGKMDYLQLLEDSVK